MLISRETIQQMIDWFKADAIVQQIGMQTFFGDFFQSLLDDNPDVESFFMFSGPAKEKVR